MTQQNPLLIIDPGHGGEDDGGGSNQQWLEKDFVLKISLYQYQRFQALGVPVALTREQEQTLGWRERTDVVKNADAVYCLSNHINAGGGEGAEVIHSIYDDGALANQMMEQLVQAGQIQRRVFTRTLEGQHSDYYYMHRETGKVATQIVEYGFADHPRDVERLLSHWQVYAEAIVKAFCQFIDHPYQAPNPS